VEPANDDSRGDATVIRRIGVLAAAFALGGCGAAENREDASREIVPAAADAPSVDTSSSADTARSFAAAAVTFRLHETRPGVVDSVTVTRDGRAVQSLRAPQNLVPPETGIERISRIDLDFDGHADLALLTELAMASSRSAYWRLDPATGRFTSAGEFETLHPDSATGEHVSFNRGGHAGRLWTASRWRWQDGALHEVRREEQEWSDDAARYVRIVRERRGPTLAETVRDTLDEVELRSGPSWIKP
jgi:hypothetical protein